MTRFTTLISPRQRLAKEDALRSTLIRRAAAVVFAAIASIASAHAAENACAHLDDDAERLACYDAAYANAAATPSSQTPVSPPYSSVSIASDDAEGAPETEPVLASREESSPLEKVWELNAANKRGTFHLLPHRANYLLLARYSDDTNTLPNSPAPDHNVTTPVSVDPLEAKFQFSVKVKAWENLFGDNGDLWFAYTQQSNWQVYNGALSSPFRETNYEPEGILSLRTDVTLLGWRWRLLNLGIVHQSNGRTLPLSRSWNRAYAEFGFERGDFTVLARPWVRQHESDREDDNPDIRSFMGAGDLRVAYHRAGHVYSALGRYSDTGKRGSLQLDWAFPISGSLKGYVQATSGYGETLLDYNHSQTTLGVGLLLVPWQ